MTHTRRALCSPVTVQKHRQIDSGRFSCVVSDANRLYATRYDSNEVRMYSYNNSGSNGGGNSSWAKTSSFKVPTNGITECTVSVHNDEITCCLNGDHKIDVYTTRGHLLRSYGTKGCYESGELYEPRVCDDDADGNALIVEWGNSRVQVLSGGGAAGGDGGEFRAVTLQPPAQGPCSAVLFDNCLYIAAARLDQMLISKYSCD